MTITPHQLSTSQAVCGYNQSSIQQILSQSDAPTSANLTTSSTTWYEVNRSQNGSWTITPYYGGHLSFKNLCALIQSPNIDLSFKSAILAHFGLNSLSILPLNFILEEHGLQSKSNAPKASFQKISNSEYLVDVKNSSAPFWLNFLESYSNDWKVYLVPGEGSMIRGENSRNSILNPLDFVSLTTNPISEQNHALLNGFANAWYLTPNQFWNSKQEKISSDGKASFTLLLYYQPQTYFAIGVLVSLVTGPVVLTFLLWTSLAKSGRRRVEEIKGDLELSSLA
jgi:hypothetical protein